MSALGLDLKGRIPADEQAAPGRAVARFTDLGWGDRLRELFAPGTPDGEVPVPLRHAVVAVLDAWPFEERPEGIVLIDESGFQLQPLVRRTWAPRSTAWISATIRSSSTRTRARP